MKTTGWSVGVLSGALLLGTTGFVAPMSTAAQQMTPNTERSACRCVDKNGDEIPDCTCFRTVTPGTLGDLMVRGFARPDARAHLGVTVSATQDASADAKGAKVQSVLDDGPADEAGIHQGDIITRIDGRSLFDPLDPSVEKGFDLDQSIPVQRLLAIAHGLQPDTTVEVEYMRDGKPHTTTVTTKRLDSWSVVGTGPVFDGRILRGSFDSLQDRLGSLGRSGHSWRCPGETGNEFGALAVGNECIGGLRLITLNPGLASYFKTDQGVLVSDVDPTSPTGLQPGDVILQIAGRDAQNPEKTRRILASYSGDEDIDFHIVRRGKAMDVRGHIGG